MTVLTPSHLYACPKPGLGGLFVFSENERC